MARLIVEVDELWVVQLLSRSYEYQHLLNMYIGDCLNLIREGRVMVVRHIFREGNHCADHLANLAHEGTDGLVRLPNPRGSLLPSLHANAFRHGRLRF